ncbi:MAG: amidohydrolase family protein [Maricaulaceae bacterium]
MLIKRVYIGLGGTVGLALGLLSVLPTPKPAEASTAAADLQAHAADPQTWAMTSVTAFDGTDWMEDATLVVEKGRVRALGPDATPPPGAPVMDGTGRTVVPGLIDAHVHTWGSALTDAARFGVTTVLDMFTDPTDLKARQAPRESLDPQSHADVFSAGMIATAPGGHGTQFGVAVEPLTAPDQAADWVKRRIAEGSDYIKLAYIPRQNRIPSLDLATATALIEAAHAEGVLAVAHISTLAAAQELLDAGVDGFVHIFADEVADAAFIAQAAAQDVFVIPTLAVIAAINGQANPSDWREDPYLGAYVSPLQAASLGRRFGSGAIPGFDLKVALENVGLLHRAGVDILAGTEAPNPGTAHGVSLFDELALLVKAGLSPKEALAAATRVPAQRFGLSDRGRLAPGARADLVVLAANPRLDITQARTVTRVYKNGAPIVHKRPNDRSAQTLPGAVLGAFEDGLDAPDGFAWSTTQDAMMGGASSAEINWAAPGVLTVSGAVRAGFAYPWAGAYVGASDFSAGRDLSRFKGVSFKVRGSPGVYRLMAFMPDVLGAPPTAVFDIAQEWRTVSVRFEDLAGFQPGSAAGFAFVAGPALGAFAFELDEVVLTP